MKIASSATPGADPITVSATKHQTTLSVTFYPEDGIAFPSLVDMFEAVALALGYSQEAIDKTFLEWEGQS